MILRRGESFFSSHDVICPALALLEIEDKTVSIGLVPGEFNVGLSPSA